MCVIYTASSLIDYLPSFLNFFPPELVFISFLYHRSSWMSVSLKNNNDGNLTGGNLSHKMEKRIEFNMNKS